MAHSNSDFRLNEKTRLVNGQLEETSSLNASFYENQDELTPRLMQLVRVRCGAEFCEKERTFICEVIALFHQKNQPCGCDCSCKQECCTVCLHNFLGSFTTKFAEVGDIPEEQCSKDACKRLHNLFLSSQSIVKKIRDKVRCERCASYCECKQELCWTCSASFYEECRKQFFRLEEKSSRCKKCARDVVERLSACSASCYQKCKDVCCKVPNGSGCCYNSFKKFCNRYFWVISEFFLPIIATFGVTYYSFKALADFGSKEPGLVYGGPSKGMLIGLVVLVLFRNVMALLFYYFRLKKFYTLLLYFVLNEKLLTHYTRNVCCTTDNDKRNEKEKNGLTCAHFIDKKIVKFEFIDHVLTIIMIYFENLPEDIIWIIVYTCYEKRDSSFLGYKTIIQIIMAFFETMRLVVKLSQNKFKRKKTSFSRLRLVVLFGIIFKLVLSSLLAYLTLVYTRASGISFHHRLSSSFQSLDFTDTQWYFHDVSLFINKAGQPDAWRSNSTSHAWMQLFYLDEIMSNDQIMFKFKYQNSTADTVNMATWKKVVKTDTNWTLSGCYSMNIFVERIWPCPDELLNGTETYFMTFHFVSNETYFIGQIFFNMKVEDNGTVWDWNAYTLAKNITQPYSSMLRYFRHLTHSEIFLYHYLFNKTSFYEDHSAELIDVVNIWRTGLATCPCQGTLWPILDPSLEMSID